MEGYSPCAAVACWNGAIGFFSDVPLCGDHHHALRAMFTPPEPETLPSQLADALVYYVTWPGSDYVKIGTSQRVGDRMRSLSKPQRRSRLLVAEPGSYEVERRRHRQFAHLRRRGTELFSYVPQIVDHIGELRREHPNWRALAGVGRRWD